MTQYDPLQKQSMTALTDTLSAMADQTCPLCAQLGTKAYADLPRDRVLFQCIRCGTFYLTDEAKPLLRQRTDLHLFLLSGVTRERSDHESRRLLRNGEQREFVQIDTRSLNGLIAQAPRAFDVAAKVRRLLAAVARESRQPGCAVDIDSTKDYPLACARGVDEMRYLFDYAVELGWLAPKVESLHDVDMRCRLTPKGWEEVQSPGRIDSTTAFVAMWFDASLTSAYTDAIKPAIEDDCRYRAIRVDLEDTNNEDIVDEILAQIRASRFVVADLTGHRHGVYFEAGFAKGLGIPVIWTCRRNDFDEHRTFDTEHYNHIVWNDPAELRTKLANRIRASIGVGSLELQSK